MVGKKRESVADERLDSLGREIIRASAANQAEAEEAASSPFLYTRIAARIRQERERLEEGERWFALLGVVWRAVPAMALVAIFAVALFLTAYTRQSATGSPGYDALLVERDAGIERVVFEDRQALSSDDVLATIIDDEREVSR